MVVVLIIGVRMLEQPWRGIVDAGVVVGLTWGLLAILGWGIGAAMGRDLGIPPDVPADASLAAA